MKYNFLFSVIDTDSDHFVDHDNVCTTEESK